MCVRAMAMLLLVLLAGAASAIAFTSHGRERRWATGSDAGAGAGAGSFATSGAFGSGYGGAGGAGGFAFPGPTASFGPSAFAFRNYFDQMEAMLAAQQAQAQQALSNGFWADWRSTFQKLSEAARRPASATGVGAGAGAGAGAGYAPGFFHYFSGPSHAASNVHPHRFNGVAANAIPNNVDAGQGWYGAPTQTAGAVSGGGGGGGGGDSGFGYGGSFQAGHGSASPSARGQGAQASLAVSNRGGFGQAQLFPDPNLSTRIAGDIAPLSGGSYGVFSSSSSSSHSDTSGKTHTFKQATVGVNDNGKVTTFSVKDP